MKGDGESRMLYQTDRRRIRAGFFSIPAQPAKPHTET